MLPRMDAELGSSARFQRGGAYVEGLPEPGSTPWANRPSSVPSTAVEMTVALPEVLPAMLHQYSSTPATAKFAERLGTRNADAWYRNVHEQASLSSPADAVSPTVLFARHHGSLPGISPPTVGTLRDCTMTARVRSYL